MIFQTPRRDYTFEIPGEWWRFAEMERFAISPGGYYPYAVQSDEEVLIVSVDEVEPPRRNSGVTLLKKYKLMPVLFAFNSPECALPSIEGYESRAVGPYRFSVHNGYHRFSGSVAAGYSHLPVIVRLPFALND
jgi:hypothetical protein